MAIYRGKAGMNGRKSGDWSPLDNEDEYVGLDEAELSFLNNGEDDEADELEVFEGWGKEKRKKRDSGVRRHRKSTLSDKWFEAED